MASSVSLQVLENIILYPIVFQTQDSYVHQKPKHWSLFLTGKVFKKACSKDP